MATVYCHINKVNGKKYIGITSTTVERRWATNGAAYKGSYFYDNGIDKFGWDNFIHLILTDDVSLSLAEQIEARLIRQLNTMSVDNGYNDSPGTKIQNNKDADSLTNLFIKKIEAVQNKKDDTIILPIEYTYDSPRYTIDFLVDLNNKHQLNTELDCQRGYIWTLERQQGMWDTLLRGHRIPECHAVRTSAGGIPVYEIIDGKQRITTIIKIVNNEIPFLKRCADPIYHPLFDTKAQIFYKDLPSYLKNRIMTQAVNFAVYINISDEDLVVLFRKLNASMPLSDFSKGIASCITIRNRFTRYITNTEEMRLLFDEKEAMRSEDELFLVRVLFMLKYGCGNVNLTPLSLKDKYGDFTVPELTKYRNIIQEGLSKYHNCLEKFSQIRSKNSWLPIIFYYFLRNNIDNKNAESFVDNFLLEEHPVRGEDFSKKRAEIRYKMIDEFFHC